MKKFWIILAIILIIGIGAYAYSKNVAKAPTNEQTASENTPSLTPTPTKANSTPTPSSSSTKPTPTTHYSDGSEGETGGAGIQVYEVDYTDQGFSPASTNLNVGDYVFFKNTSAVNFLPIDSAYAGFDAKQAVTPGKQYKFQFNQAGTWTVQNKLNPSQTTVVVVK